MIFLKYILVGVILIFFKTISFAQISDKPTLDLGGCLRFNYRYNNWDEASKNQLGSLQYDVFRLNADATYKQLQLHAEFRFYSKSNGGGMLKSGWIGYNFNTKHQLRFGQTVVPFGILPYQSNSYFFNINYYIGLEDDDDFGISYQYTGEHWQFNAAFFKNADLFNSEGSEVAGNRYSYDIAGRSKEINTIAGRVSYKRGDNFKYEFGISAFAGQVYNIDSKKSDDRYAAAIHAVLDWNNFNLKTQASHFDYSCKESMSNGYIIMTAFDAPYKVTDKGQTYSVCLSYTIPFKNKLVNNMKFYNDYSFLHKSREGFNNSHMNVTGCSVLMGPVLIYADVATAKNQPWLGLDWDESFALGEDNKWHTRFNLNVGYYF